MSSSCAPCKTSKIKRMKIKNSLKYKSTIKNAILLVVSSMGILSNPIYRYLSVNIDIAPSVAVTKVPGFPPFFLPFYFSVLGALIDEGDADIST